MLPHPPASPYARMCHAPGKELGSTRGQYELPPSSECIGGIAQLTSRESPNSPGRWFALGQGCCVGGSLASNCFVSPACNAVVPSAWESFRRVLRMARRMDWVRWQNSLPSSVDGGPTRSFAFYSNCQRLAPVIVTTDPPGGTELSGPVKRRSATGPEPGGYLSRYHQWERNRQFGTARSRLSRRRPRPSWDLGSCDAPWTSLKGRGRGEATMSRRRWQFQRRARGTARREPAWRDRRASPRSTRCQPPHR